MYNNSNINISYYNGDLKVEFTNQKGINSGKIRPSCDGYITSGDGYITSGNVWTGPGSEDNWIGD